MINWETIIVAGIAGLGPALISLIPMYLRMREDAKQKSFAAAAAERKLQNEITDAARKASEDLIRQLAARVDDLEKYRDELEQKLDEERSKRRLAESKLAEAEIEISRLKSKVDKLEKRDTGELKGRA